MKIEVKPGRSVRLTRTTYTSSRGGTYDISQLSEADQKRVKSEPGVSLVRAKPAGGTKAKEEDS